MRRSRLQKCRGHLHHVAIGARQYEYRLDERKIRWAATGRLAVSMYLQQCAEHTGNQVTRSAFSAMPLIHSHLRPKVIQLQQPQGTQWELMAYQDLLTNWSSDCRSSSEPRRGQEATHRVSGTKQHRLHPAAGAVRVSKYLAPHHAQSHTAARIDMLLENVMCLWRVQQTHLVPDALAPSWLNCASHHKSCHWLSACSLARGLQQALHNKPPKVCGCLDSSCSCNWSGDTQHSSTGDRAAANMTGRGEGAGCGKAAAAGCCDSAPAPCPHETSGRLSGGTAWWVGWVSGGGTTRGPFLGETDTDDDTDPTPRSCRCCGCRCTPACGTGTVCS